MDDENDFNLFARNVFAGTKRLPQWLLAPQKGKAEYPRKDKEKEKERKRKTRPEGI